MMNACMSDGVKIQFLCTVLTFAKRSSSNISFGKISSSKIGFSNQEYEMDLLKM